MSPIYTVFYTSINGTIHRLKECNNHPVAMHTYNKWNRMQMSDPEHTLVGIIAQECLTRGMEFIGATEAKGMRLTRTGSINPNWQHARLTDDLYHDFKHFFSLPQFEGLGNQEMPSDAA